MSKFFCALVALLTVAPLADAQFTYRLDGIGNTAPGNYENFNNSLGTETEDCWVANSYTTVATGTRISSVGLLLGTGVTARSVTATIYTGTSLTNPQAGGGLVPIHTTTATVTSANDSIATVTLSTPVDLPVGQIFYASILIRGVTGAEFPFSSDAGIVGGPAPLGQSFFDIGPTVGGTYNVNNTGNATVLGSSHPVLLGSAQSPGNAAIIVQTIPVPEPGSVAVIAVTVAGFGAAVRRRRVRSKELKVA